MLSVIAFVTENEGNALKLSFFAADDRPEVMLAVDRVCRVRGIEPAALFLAEKGAERSRLGKPAGEARRLGPSNPFFSAMEKLETGLDRLAGGIIREEDVSRLLRTAFPDRPFTLDDLARLYGFSVVRLNGMDEDAVRNSLRHSGADLAMILGDFPFRPGLYDFPPMGAVMLDLAGTYPAEEASSGLAEGCAGARSAWVAVRRLENGHERGSILELSRVRLHPFENKDSLNIKLALEGAKLLAGVAGLLAAGKAPGAGEFSPEAPAGMRQKTCLRPRPGFNERALHLLKQALKTAAYLCIYRLGIYGFLRRARRARRSERARILLLHRVNDMSRDSLTTGTVAFARMLVTLKRFYSVRSTSWLVERLKNNEPIPPDTIVIHFDDCYRDVYENALPLLKAAGFPATFFVSSGYIDSDRAFSHDACSPFTFENLRSDEVKDIALQGFEIGAHSVEHEDMGSMGVRDAEREVLKSREDLQAIIGSPVHYFSFPFGKSENVSEEVRRLVKEAGFKAMFSVCPAPVGRRSDMFDLPRLGVSGEHRPLDLLMELEGISLADAKRLPGCMVGICLSTGMK